MFGLINLCLKIIEIFLFFFDLFVCLLFLLFLYGCIYIFGVILIIIYLKNNK